MIKAIKVSILTLLIVAVFSSSFVILSKSTQGKNKFKARIFTGFLELPYTFWVDNRPASMGYTIFRQDIPDEGKFIGTLIIGNGTETVLKNAIKKHILKTRYPVINKFNYELYEIIEFKQENNSKSLIKDKVIIVIKGDEFVMFISVENDNEWKIPISNIKLN